MRKSLGAALRDADGVAELRRLSITDFALAGFRDVAESIMGLDSQAMPVSPDTVRADLERRGAPGSHGTFIFEMYQHAPPVPAAAVYADRIITAARDWRMLQLRHELDQLLGLDSSDERGHPVPCRSRPPAPRRARRLVQ